MTKPRDSTTKTRARRAERSELFGPMREVVYIFEREGERGGGLWWLILDCGHAISRKRYVTHSCTAIAQMMFRPITEKLAPKRCQCHYCGSGSPKQDPWIMIKAFGGPTP